jgi:hypothetical protein
LNLIYTYCDENEVNLSEIFNPNEGTSGITAVNYEQFLDGLRKAKIPFPIAHIDDIMKYLVSFFFNTKISIHYIYLGKR